MINKLKPWIVPMGIRFLSDWKDFFFYKLPPKCIINKQIPGCGFTERVINGIENCILAEPRIAILESKYGKHTNDVYLVKNELLDADPGVDKDLSKMDKSQSISQQISSGDIFEEKLKDCIDPNQRKQDIYNRLMREIKDYINMRDFYGKPYKILVTYDSYRIVQDILIAIGKFDTFYTIVDEFQSILHDSRFKSNTENEFLGYLKKSHSAIFVSATPLLDKYLNMLDEFDGLPYIEFDWLTEDPVRVVKPSLKIRTMKSVGTKAADIIQTYLDGNFERATRIINGFPVEIESREAVLFMNSVNHVISIIKKCKLTADQVLILCAKTEDNKKKIKKKLGKLFEIGHVPIIEKGEIFPMFTFCTSTVYLGADFDSYCARTFIFSDANLETLSVDVSDDLGQILGRQRKKENPWYNSAEFYYRTTCDYRKMPQEEFMREIERKEKATKDLLDSYTCAPDSAKNTLALTYQYVAKSANYKDNYVSVNTHGGTGLFPISNNLVKVNELRVFEIQQYDYADRFMLFSVINERITQGSLVNQEVMYFFNKYDQLGTFKEKLRLLCEYDMSDEARSIALEQIGEHDNIRSYYLTLKPERLRALSYDKTKIERELGVVVFSKELLVRTIFQNFKVGDRISTANAKIKLGQLYNSINYKATPKATDLDEYFNNKETKIIEILSDGAKKKVKAIELISVKPYYQLEYNNLLVANNYVEQENKEGGEDNDILN